MEECCVIYEKLELEKFPFDCQDLQIYIDARLGCASFELRPFAGEHGTEMECVALDAALKEPGVLNDFVLSKLAAFTYQFQRVTQASRQVSCLKISLKIERKPMFYILNVMAAMAIISSLIFTSWALHPADIPSRHGVDFTLLLTAYAFKLYLNDLLPKVSYLCVAQSHEILLQPHHFRHCAFVVWSTRGVCS
eukprot:SAG31_NODE_4052_length_3634_cov_2.642716_2_plen_193_part_00